MGSRAFGELLLRPRTLTRLAPSWPARLISHSASAPAAPRVQRPDTATTPEVAAQSPTQASQTDANAAIDDLFSTPSADNNTTTTPPLNRLFGDSFSPRSARDRRPPGLAFDTMLTSDAVQNPSLANKPASNLQVQQKATFESYPRLGPEYGRTVTLDSARGRDIVRGIGMLGSLIARNKVKYDFNKQRFHERGGLKRKRLNSERWRARFKKGFQSVTGRVVELTKKGW